MHLGRSMWPKLYEVVVICGGSYGKGKRINKNGDQKHHFVIARENIKDCSSASLQTQRSSSQLSSRRFFAWSHCLSSGTSLSHPVLITTAAIWLWLVFSWFMSVSYRSSGEASQGTYTYQIFLEKEQIGPRPSVQQLLDTSFMSSDLKFEEVGAPLLC